eukprot:gene8763-9665_t
MPQIQIYVIRIILTCPVYAFSSTIALFVGPYAVYAETIRDIYEAIVIYAFFNLILEYGGGETDCVYAIENDGMMKMPFPLCCLKPRHRSAKLLRFCHRGVLQFIITKPIMALLDIIFLAAGIYNARGWQITQMLIYNISYAWALYCLAVLYLALEKVISQFRPMAKFATVKMIIFATFYQSVILRFTLSRPGTAVEWNNFLLCLEMVFFSLAFMLAFPIQEFNGGIPHRRVLQNAKEVFTLRDVVQNIYHNFNPDYRDYALQNCQQEVPSTIHVPTHMTGNLSRVAREMSERYRGRSQKKSFNALLRGSNPITARIRRDMYGGNSSNNSSQHSVINEDDSFLSHDQSFDDMVTAPFHDNERDCGGVLDLDTIPEEKSLEMSTMDIESGGEGSIHSLSGSEKLQMKSYEDQPSKSAIGRLPLRIKSKQILNVPTPIVSPVIPQSMMKASSPSSSSEGIAGVISQSEDVKERLEPASPVVHNPMKRVSDPFNSPSVEWSDYVDYVDGSSS